MAGLRERYTVHATRRTGLARAAMVCALVLASCGDDGQTTGPDTTTTVSPATTLVPTTLVPTTLVPPTIATTTTVARPPTTTSTIPWRGLGQPAIWPAPDVVFDSPEAAARDFVAKVAGVPPVLSTFRQGDARSGEIDVLFTGESPGSVRIVRSMLLVRQLGPRSGWFVQSAASDGATINAPVHGSSVRAGAVTVSGRARGFEALVVVDAYLVGDASRRIDRQLAYGGSMETPEPFTATLDLSSAAPGDLVLIMIHGGVGLETDPGDFAAIAVQVA